MPTVVWLCDVDAALYEILMLVLHTFCTVIFYTFHHMFFFSFFFILQHLYNGIMNVGAGKEGRVAHRRHHSFIEQKTTTTTAVVCGSISVGT